MTGGCGLVHSYWQLFLLRMGVGVGEASLSPAAYSMISDSFPPAKRPMAFSIYTMGIYVGSGCAFLFGALLLRAFTGKEIVQLPILGASQPWQVLFLILGTMGIICALVLLTLYDPSRKDARVFQSQTGKAKVEPIPLSSVIGFFNQNRMTFLWLSLGLAMWAIIAYGSSAWEITFLVRNHHLSASQAGTFYGGAMIVCGTLGVIVAGKTASWLMTRGRRDAYLWVAVCAAAAWLLPGTLYPVVPNTTASIILIYVCTFFRGMPTFVILAAVLDLVPNAMRGQTTALYILVVTLIGLGIGPTAIALVTDHLFGYDAAVRYSLVIVPVLAWLLAEIFFLKGLRSYTASLDYLQHWLKQNV
jgi:MFS family permease